MLGKTPFTFVTFGWSSLCQTATSCLNDARRAAASAEVAMPSSPQSNTFTIMFMNNSGQ